MSGACILEASSLIWKKHEHRNPSPHIVTQIFVSGSPALILFYNKISLVLISVIAKAKGPTKGTQVRIKLRIL